MTTIQELVETEVSVRVMGDDATGIVTNVSGLLKNYDKLTSWYLVLTEDGFGGCWFCDEQIINCTTVEFGRPVITINAKVSKPEIPLLPEPKLPRYGKRHEFTQWLLDALCTSDYTRARVGVELPNLEQEEYDRLEHVSYSVYRTGAVYFSTHEVVDFTMRPSFGYLYVDIRVY